MNRAQRRSREGKKIQRDIELKRRNQMAFKAEEPVLPVQFAHGHTAEQVVVEVRRPNQPVEQFSFSIEQAEAWIAGMQHSIVGLRALKADQAAGKPN